MSSVNKVILLGNVGKDPEIRNTQSGSRLASFSIATSERWTDKQSGEKKENTHWHQVVVFNDNLVTIVEKYVKKGSKLYVEGSLQTRKWQDQQGQDRWSTEVVLKAFGGQIVLLGEKGGNEARAPQSEESYVTTKTSSPESSRGSGGASRRDEFDDQIPFRCIDLDRFKP